MSKKPKLSKSAKSFRFSVKKIKGQFNPDHDYIDQAVSVYLKKGGQIKELLAKDDMRPLDSRPTFAMDQF